MKTTLLIDYGFCSGCHSCELACRNELGLGLGEWGIKLLEDGPRELDNGEWQWNYLPYPTSFCDGCVKRVEKGLAPACVQTCQGKVMYYGTPEEMVAKLCELGSHVAIFQP